MVDLRGRDKASCHCGLSAQFSGFELATSMYMCVDYTC